MKSKPLKHALWYAETMGWAVLPLHTITDDGLCSCIASECSSAGKHPRTSNGVHDASKDKSQIKGLVAQNGRILTSVWRLVRQAA